MDSMIDRKDNPIAAMRRKGSRHARTETGDAPGSEASDARALADRALEDARTLRPVRESVRDLALFALDLWWGKEPRRNAWGSRWEGLSTDARRSLWAAAEALIVADTAPEIRRPDIGTRADN